MESDVSTGVPAITVDTSALATSAKQDSEAVLVGAVTETAPASDTASSGLNGRLQRIAQRLTSLIALLPGFGTAGTASTNVVSVQGIASMTAVKVDGSGVTQPVSGTFWQSTQPVSIATAPALVAGAAVIGKVGIDQTTPGTTNLVALAANQSVNVAQINGVTTLMGAGNTGTGSQRVTIATDQAAYSVNAQVIPQSSSTNAASSVASSALATNLVVKASAGRLLQLTGCNTKASAQYIQIHNTTSLPADTAVPIFIAFVPATSNFSFDFGAIGRYFATGITVCNSSSAATKTVGSADCWFNAEYL